MLKNVPKMPMAVVRVLVLIQVGGRAGEVGCAALATRSLRSRAPRQAHAHTINAPPEIKNTFAKQETNLCNCTQSQKHGGQGDAADPLGVRPVVSAARNFNLLSAFWQLSLY